MILRDQINSELERIKDGWCSPEKGLAIAETIIRERAKNCVEIGIFAGKSLICAAIGLKELGEGVIWGIDPWAVPDCLVDVSKSDADWWAQVDLKDIFKKFVGNLHASGLLQFVSVLRMSSFEASKIVAAPIDYLHIDGCHGEWSSTSDVCLYLPKVKPGGIVLLDDVNWESTQTAIRFVEKWADKLETIEGKESTCTFYRKR